MSFSTTLLSTAAPSPKDGTGRICELCGDRRYEIVGSRDRHGQPLDTAICMGCGLVAHLHIPSDAELKAYYTTQYRRQYHGEAAPSPRRVMRAWKNGQRILRQLDPFLRRDCSVLEVGAGIGCTVKAFELGGHHASGIDLGLQFLQYGRNLLHAKLEKSSLFDLPPEPRFDLVCLVHVIEHFNSPTSALHPFTRSFGRADDCTSSAPISRPLSPPANACSTSRTSTILPRGRCWRSHGSVASRSSIVSRATTTPTWKCSCGAWITAIWPFSRRTMSGPSVECLGIAC